MVEPPSNELPTVWVFHGDGKPFASGVFRSKDQGLAWASRHQLTGVLTEYQVGDGCYDIAVRDGRFKPSKPHHGTSSHVAGFSPSENHVHVVNGEG